MRASGEQSPGATRPPGWDVTLDLVGKLAAVLNEAPEPDHESWFRDRFGSAPDYSDLLDQLAKTQSERQQLLRTYWEPTEEEREEGEKDPTAAHRAIAALAAQGFIKVIVTTNFDKLMERALSAAGIEATVLSTADQIQGAPPLAHIQHLVFKVHGDYLDTRIRNTEAELAAYPPEVDALLERIFNEYGLIVCGWSGDWDPALRAALERASSRRYTTYWTTRSGLSAVVQRLIAHRSAEEIQIEDANTFFEKLMEDVTAIEEFSKPHPLSVDVAATKLKRYMSEARYRIQLSDLIEETVQEVVEKTSHDGFSPSDPNLDPGRNREADASVRGRLREADGNGHARRSMGGARALPGVASGTGTSQLGEDDRRRRDLRYMARPRTVPGDTPPLRPRNRGDRQKPPRVSPKPVLGEEP